MLSAWYFCSRIGTNPEQTNVFLSILDELSSAELRKEIGLIPYQELARTNTWMQIYAFPYVVESLADTPYSNTLEECLRPYFEFIKELLPANTAEAFDTLFQILLQGSRASEFQVLDNVKVCAQMMAGAQIRKTTSTPYLDLREFTPEVILLSLVKYYAQLDPQYRSRLTSEFSSEGSHLYLLIQNALHYTYGRYPLLLAAEIALLTLPEYSQDDGRQRLAHTLATQPNCCIRFEPDLLRAYAIARFVGEPGNLIASLNTGDVLREALAFEYFPSQVQDNQAAGSILGSSLSPEQQVSICLVYWQAVLWELAAEADPEFTLNWLAEAWAIPERWPASPLRISFHSSDLYWEQKLLALARLRVPANYYDGISIEFGNYSFDMRREPNNWVFLSPALPFVPGSVTRNRKLNGLDRYPQAGDISSLIRLAVGGIIASSLLQNSSKRDDLSAGRRAMAAMVVHAADVIYLVYGRWLRVYARETPQSHGKGMPRLSGPLTGLVLFTERKLQMMGKGQLESVPPDEFINLLQDDIQHSNAGRAENFQKFVLPTVLVRWVADGFAGAVSGSPSARWLAHLSTIEDRYPYSFFVDNKYENPFLAELPILIRFLGKQGDFSYSRYACIDWKKGLDSRGNLIERWILLTKPLHFSEWQNFPWDETALQNHPPLALAWATERLASIQSGDLAAPKEEWLKQWQNALSNITNKVDLDRYARLRLIEFLDHPIIADSIESQEMIAYAILENGWPYDLDLLFKRIFGQGERPITEIRRKLQQIVLSVLFNQHELALQRKEIYPNARIPRRVKEEQAKIEVVEQFFTKIAAPLTSDLEANEQYNQLRERLASLRTESLNWQCKKDFRSVIEDIEILSQQKYLTGPLPVAGEWAVQAITYNPNEFSVEIYFRDLEIGPEVGILFGKTRSEIDRLLAEKEFFLALVSRIQPFGQRPVQFNAGLWFEPFRDENPLGLKEGDFVSLPLQRRQEDRTPVIVDGKPIRKINRRYQPGDIAQFVIQETRRDDHIELDVISPVGNKIAVNNIYWDADPSYHFNPYSINSNRNVIARLEQLDSQSTSWRPYEYRLMDLLLRIPLEGTTPQAEVLTFIEERQAEFGQICWLFSRQPGENYLLYPGDFLAQDAAEIHAKLDGSAGPGLLVSVSPVQESGSVKLGLVRVLDSVSASLYTDLCVPFDTRNWDWVELFKKPLDWKSYYSDTEKRWYIDLSRPYPNHPPRTIPGYPERVTVLWVTDSPFWGRTEETIEGFHWDREQMLIYADWAQRVEIKPFDRDWDKFWDRWYNVKEKDIFTVKRILGDLSPNGQVLCRTNDFTVITVDAESVSMAPWAHPSGNINRKAQVMKIEKPVYFDIQVDTANLPPEFADLSSCQGILIDAPQDAGASSLYRVLWKSAQEPQEIHIYLSREQTLRPGFLLFGSKRSDQWFFQAANRKIFARALWELLTSWPSTEPLYYLGVVDIEGKKVVLSQAAPGALVKMDMSTPPSRHLAYGAGSLFSGGVSFSQKYSNTSYFPYRASLKTSDGALCGRCNRTVQKDGLFIREIDLRMAPVLDGSYFDLSRDFWLEYIQTQTSPPAKDTNYDEEIRQLEVYLDQPIDMSGTYSSDGSLTLLECKVPKDPNQKVWSSKVSIAPGHNAFITGFSYSSDFTYSPQAVCRLFYHEEDSQIYGSFLMVEPHDVDKFREEICNSFEYDQKFQPKNWHLYYVACEEVDPRDKQPYSKGICHRFEWGYGKTLLVPETSLRYNGQPFNRARDFLVFYGDEITSMVFIKEDNETILDIRSIFISDRAKVYQQRWIHNFVHRLHLGIQNGQVKITQVEGFDDRASALEGLMENSRRNFQVRAELSEKSREYLQERIDQISTGKIIFARLDDEIFRNELGYRLVFDHVRLSFESIDHRSALRSKELILLQTGNITASENETDLLLSHPQNVLVDDIGTDFAKQLSVHRRQFSVREDLLPRIAENNSQNPGCLSDRAVLVKIFRDRDGGARLTMLHDVVRSKKSIITAIRSGSGLLFATVYSVRARKLILEMKPGIFIALFDEEINGIPYDLRENDIVQIDILPDERLSIHRINPSQLRYIGSESRPVLALPKNSLFSRRIFTKDIWSSRAWMDDPDFRLTIGGLPALNPIPGAYNSALHDWDPPQAEDFVALMRKKHPLKLASAGLDRQGWVRMSAYLPSKWLSGRISWEEDRSAVELSEFDPVQPGTVPLKINWRSITFADEAVSQVIERLTQRTWRYHDRVTRHWQPAGTAMTVSDRVMVKRASALNGPVFMETGAHSLRYPEDQFLTYGFPVQDLLNSIGDQAVSLPVAGISDLGGLWVELSPGRLVEIPCHMLTWETASGLHSLEKLSWNIFAPGDQVVLQVDIEDPLTPEKIILKEWHPGPRRLLGNRRAILPVIDRDDQQGALVLGAGNFRLRLPFSPTDPFYRCDLLAIYPDNYVEDGASIFPQRGDVVLIVAQDPDTPFNFSAAGLPGWAIRKDERTVYIDSLYSEFEQLRNNSRGFASFLNSLGGALPVTVEGVDQARKIIFISRRLQAEAVSIAPGQIVMAKAVGVLENMEMVLLSQGGFMDKTNLNRLVEGLPRNGSVTREVARFLPSLPHFLWLNYGTDRQMIETQLTTEAEGSETSVIPLHYIDADQDSGLLCSSIYSEKLYWMPIKDLAWLEIPPEVIQKCLVENGRQSPLHVIISPHENTSKRVSVIGTRRARGELRTLTVGRELIVEVVAPLGDDAQGAHRHLVRSVTSEVMLGLVSAKTLIPGQQLAVEVFRRSTGVSPQVLTIPVDETPQRLDLPSWMINSEIADQRQVELNQIREWLPFDSLSDPDIMSQSQALVYSYWWMEHQRKRGEESEADFSVPQLIFMQKAVRSWKSSNLMAAEIEAAYALMSILLLDWIGGRLIGSGSYSQKPIGIQNRLEAMELAHSLGKRALRSLHSEILSREWRADSALFRRSDPLSKRHISINKRISQIYKLALKSDDLLMIKNFSKVVEIQRVKDLLRVARSLAAALGSPVDAAFLLQAAPRCSQMIRIYHTLPAKGQSLTKGQVDKMRDILDKLLQTGHHFVLMDPILEFEGVEKKEA